MTEQTRLDDAHLNAIVAALNEEPPCDLATAYTSLQAEGRALVAEIDALRVERDALATAAKNAIGAIRSHQPYGKQTDRTLARALLSIPEYADFADMVLSAEAMPLDMADRYAQERDALAEQVDALRKERAGLRVTLLQAVERVVLAAQGIQPYKGHAHKLMHDAARLGVVLDEERGDA